jgi:CRISPR system Cascade subunit CasA
MELHYNLLYEAWIPCIFLDGHKESLGIKQALEKANEIQGIHAELPVMTASIHFLLLAVLYASQNIETADDWQLIWDRGDFNKACLEDYFSKWESRFDLFDTEHPFYQDIQFGKREKDLANLRGSQAIPKSISGLILHSSNGDAATLFDHSMDDNPASFHIDEMARYLLMFQTFSLGGMTSASISIDKFYTDSPSARGIVFLLQEENLFKTLLMNVIAKDSLEGYGNEMDRPAWEMDDPFLRTVENPIGMMDFLTYQSRRILLVPKFNEGQITLNDVLIGPGLKVSEEYINPFLQVYYIANGHQLDKKILRYSEGRALWRDSHVLLEERSSGFVPPKAVRWINQLRFEMLISSQIQFIAYGMCNEPGKKKAYFYREEYFSYPQQYLRDEDLRNQLKIRLEDANSIKNQLWGAVKLLAGTILSFSMDLENGRKASPIDENNLITHWAVEELFWKELEIPFYRLVATLPVNAEKAEQEWKGILSRKAQTAFEHAVQLSGENVQALKASAKARFQLRAGIKKVFVEREEEVE